jgi:hypothetical protein
VASRRVRLAQFPVTVRLAFRAVKVTAKHSESRPLWVRLVSFKMPSAQPHPG